jgi:hypothetical protein
MGTGSPFPGAKRGRGVTLTTHPHVVSRSRMSRSYTLLPPSTFVACSGTALALADICNGDALPFSWGKNWTFKICISFMLQRVNTRQDTIIWNLSPYENGTFHKFHMIILSMGAVFAVTADSVCWYRLCHVMIQNNKVLNILFAVTYMKKALKILVWKYEGKNHSIKVT